MLLILGVGEDGYREILLADVANTETRESWSRAFAICRKELSRGVRLVVSDDHTGLRQARERYFQEALWQRCQFHFLRNLLDHVAKKDKERLALSRFKVSSTALISPSLWPG